MKIHHIINSYSDKAGGAENLVRMLHMHLKNNNIQSSMFGLIASDNEINDGNTAGLKTPYSLSAFLSIKRYCEKNVKKDDIIHSHLFPSNFFCSVIKILGFTKATLITTEHSTYNRRRGKTWGKIIDIITYQACDHIIAISIGVKNQLISWMPKIKNKVLVIRNGCDLKHSNPIIRKENNKTIKLISIGALKEAKNYSMTINSLHTIRNLNFEWNIAGDGLLKEKLVKQVHNLNLNNKIFFLGHKSPIWSLLEKSDIFIMTSKWEGFGIAAVEAMNSSLPIIASNIDGLKEIVDTKPPCALLVNPCDKTDIAKKLEKLILSHKLRKELGSKAYYNSKNFDKSIMLSSYLKFYNNLVNTFN